MDEGLQPSLNLQLEGIFKSKSVDQYAKDLYALFYKAHPNVQQGTKEAEILGKTMLVNQFIVGLLPKMKSKS